ncbi:hypothetical protein [Bradyrhizobium rifense]|uniref:hypothetical protein n=1 Tax=Bradyrhizobium rifense TaxID=515499 RepID=UPI0016530D79|nr:hypothetical protein [Bradyrhizobium rifense]
MNDFSLNIGFFLPFDEAFALAKKKQCSCPIDAGTYALRTICRAFARYTLAVIARLDRAIQYSVKPVIEPRSRGVLDAPLSRGMTPVL